MSYPHTVINLKSRPDATSIPVNESVGVITSYELLDGSGILHLTIYGEDRPVGIALDDISHLGGLSTAEADAFTKAAT
jgi:hypothetical protein